MTTNDNSEQSESEDPQTRVGHCKADPFDVYIGRGAGGRDMLETPIGKRGWLGNPHSVDDYGREGSIERFRKAFEYRLENDPEFRARVRNLAGKRLGCWCQRLDEDEPACHGEVIAEHADRLAREGELVTDGGEEVEAETDQEKCRLCGEPYIKAVVGDECHSLSVQDAERVCVYSHGVNATVFIHGAIQ